MNLLIIKNILKEIIIMLRKQFKKSLALILVFMMVMSFIPTTYLSAEEEMISELTIRTSTSTSDWSNALLAGTVNSEGIEVFSSAKAEYDLPAVLDTTTQLRFFFNKGSNVESITLKWGEGFSKSKVFTTTTTQWANCLEVGKNTLMLSVVGKDSSTKDYIFNINVNPTLSELSLSSNGAPIYLNEKFETKRTEYTANIPNTVNELTVSAKGKSDGYNLQYNDSDYSTVDISKENIVSIVVSASAITTTYNVSLIKIQAFDASISATPNDASIMILDSNGAAIARGLGYVEANNLIGGEKYVVSKNGYITQSGLISSDNNIIDINLIDTEQASSPLPNYTGDWTYFRGNPENMGITNAETPNSAETAVLKWAQKLGTGWSAAPTPPLILNDALYLAANSKVYKIDKNNGDILQESETLAGSLGYALNPIAYGDGMFFIPIQNGRIQALRADTLESLWVSEGMGSMAQSISPAMYHNGYVYTGTWNSGEENVGTYYCISVADEDLNSKTETKLHSWKLTHKGGFYWAGAYVSNDYLLVGSDDGSSGYQSETAVFYSLDPRTGDVIDAINGIKGDIRSTVAFVKNELNDGGTAFFSTKGGLFCTVKVDVNGKFINNTFKTLDLNGMCTGTALVYNNRAYVGSSGAQQFGPGKLNVIDLSENEPKLAYAAVLPGYPQASALLSTAYDDTAHIYITYNSQPGGIYAIRDKAGQTVADGFDLFIPEKAQQQYSICSLVADNNGVIYYKNDSCYLMAIGTKSAYLEGLSSNIGTFDKSFVSGTLSYELVVPVDTQSVILTVLPCEGGTYSINVTDSNEIALVDGKATAEIVVSKDGITRTYTIIIREASNNAMLQNARANLSNTFINEEFDFDLSDESESFSWHNDNKDEFRRIWVKPVNSKSTIRGFAVSGVSSSMNGLELEEGTELEAISGTGESIGYSRYNVYFADNNTEATIKLTATAEDGISTKDYIFTVSRPVNGSDPSKPEDKISVTFRLIGSTLSDDDVDLGSPIGFAGAKYQTWINTGTYTLNKNAKVYDLFTMALDSAGLSYTGAERNYIDTIWAPDVFGAYRLAEFTNGPRSGWMYTVNGIHPSFGLQEWPLNNGDMVVWHYVNDYSYEVSDWFDDDPAYPSLGNSSTWNKWLKAPDVEPTKENANLGSSTTPSTNEVADIVIQAKVVSNEASSKVSEEQIKESIEKAKNAEDVNSINIKSEVNEDITKSTVTIPKSSLIEISIYKLKLNIDTALGIISLSEKALNEISKQAQSSSVEIVIENVASNKLTDEQKSITEGNVVYDISIISAGKKISSFGGEKITISLPYDLKDGQLNEKVSVWYMNDNGELEKINCTYDEKTGLATFTTDHLSYYVVAYDNSISFADVKEIDWFYKYVSYVTGRGLFSGTSENTFSPNKNMTRAMVATVLYRLDEKPVVAKAASFLDLVAGEYYIDAVNWSSEKEIVNGVTKTEFKPNSNVTREQLALMLYRYAISKNMVSGVTGSLESFADKDKISSWALEAMKWAVEKGIIAGKSDNKLDPTGSATRAEVAAMLQRYIENVK
jgi:hypothetical protein